MKSWHYCFTTGDSADDHKNPTDTSDSSLSCLRFTSYIIHNCEYYEHNNSQEEWN